MSGVLGFLSDPVTSLAEIHRILKPGGRFLALGSDSKLAELRPRLSPLPPGSVSTTTSNWSAWDARPDSIT